MGLRTESMIGYVQEKIKGIGGESVKTMKETTQAKLKEMGADEMIRNLSENLSEKLKDRLVMLENFGLSLMARWLDKASSPPQTKKEEPIQHWIHVSSPTYVVPAVFSGLLLLWCCRRCLGYCCRSKGVKDLKMMKAPGRDYRMPRNDFEANPKGYFRGLHARKLR